jgi:hypothetical protein
MSYARGVRYCPNIPCPHRQRVASPAEFLDHVTHCSDCGTRLVASEEDAIQGLRADAHNPYRAAGPIRADAASPPVSSFLPWGTVGRTGEVAQAILLMLGALLVAFLAYGVTGSRSALYLTLLGPLLQRALTRAKRS